MKSWSMKCLCTAKLPALFASSHCKHALVANSRVQICTEHLATTHLDPEGMFHHQRGQS